MHLQGNLNADQCSVSRALMDRVAGAGLSGAKEAPGFRGGPPPTPATHQYFADSVLGESEKDARQRGVARWKPTVHWRFYHRFADIICCMNRYFRPLG